MLTTFTGARAGPVSAGYVTIQGVYCYSRKPLQFDGPGQREPCVGEMKRGEGLHKNQDKRIKAIKPGIRAGAILESRYRKRKAVRVDSNPGQGAISYNVQMPSFFLWLSSY